MKKKVEGIWNKPKCSNLEEMSFWLNTIRDAKFKNNYAKIAKFSTREIQNKLYHTKFKLMLFYTYLQSELHFRLYSITTTWKMNFSMKDLVYINKAVIYLLFSFLGKFKVREIQRN